MSSCRFHFEQPLVLDLRNLSSLYELSNPLPRVELSIFFVDYSFYLIRLRPLWGRVFFRYWAVLMVVGIPECSGGNQVPPELLRAENSLRRKTPRKLSREKKQGNHYHHWQQAGTIVSVFRLATSFNTRHAIGTLSIQYRLFLQREPAFIFLVWGRYSSEMAVSCPETGAWWKQPWNQRNHYLHQWRVP